MNRIGIRSLNLTETDGTVNVRVAWSWWTSRRYRDKVRTEILGMFFDRYLGQKVITCL